MEAIESIAPYLPMFLLMDNLRVTRAVVSAVLMNTAVSGGLAGSMRDCVNLWYLDHQGLGHLETGSRGFSVASIRHGNSFDLVNEAILETANLVGQSRRTCNMDVRSEGETAAGTYRHTTVYVSFLHPGNIHGQDSKAKRLWHRGVFCLTVLVQFILLLIPASILLWKDFIVAGFLLICIMSAQIVIYSTGYLVKPIFANGAAMELDKSKTARDGAALDVHIVAEGWNSSHLYVLCGYSSQLHSLTNIAIRSSSPRVFLWLCRILSFILASQAALLAGTTNSEKEKRWSGMIWLTALFAIALVKKGIQAAVGTENVLISQPASLETIEPIHFSGRRAALVFVSMLPVSEKSDRWAWLDVFMPNNPRRQELQQVLESSADFQETKDWAISAQPARSAPASMITRKAERGGFVEEVLSEAVAAFRRPKFRDGVRRYLETVFPSKLQARPEWRTREIV